MNDANPDTSPLPVIAGSTLNKRSVSELEIKELKKLYGRSRNVSAITFLLMVGTLILGAVAFNPPSTLDNARAWFIGLAVFYAVAVVGLYQRTSWGRILGIFVCGISLINIPFGTIIGLCGLFAFFGSPQLFGPDRLTQKELKAEIKLRKTNSKIG